MYNPSPVDPNTDFAQANTEPELVTDPTIASPGEDHLANSEADTNQADPIEGVGQVHPDAVQNNIQPETVANELSMTDVGNTPESAENVENVAEHVENVAEHVDKVSENVENISVRVEDVSENVENTSDHVELTIDHIPEHLNLSENVDNLASVSDSQSERPNENVEHSTEVPNVEYTDTVEPGLKDEPAADPGVIDETVQHYLELSKFFVSQVA